MSMQKAIVIGAGIGGLASAIRLATKGYQVQVFESNTYTGGKLTAFNLGDYRFDAGPSLFTMPELVDEIFRLAGKNPRDYFQYQKLDVLCHYFYEDGVRLQASADNNAFAIEIEKKLAVDKSVVLKHLKKSAFIYDSTAYLFLERSLHKIKSYLSLKVAWSFLKLPFLGVVDTMHGANKKALKNEKLIQLFDRYATYNGSNPYQAPGILNIIPHLEFGKGAYFPTGGMHEISQSLYRLALDLGVEFHLETKVDEILVSKKSITGIKVKGEKFDASLVVCNMDIAYVYKHLLPNKKKEKKVLSQERSSSALIFYWGINKTFKALDLHNILFSDDYKNEFTNLFEKKSISNDPTVYINISSKLNHTDAPQNAENWFVMINVPCNIGQDWDKLISKARQNIISKINRILKTDIEKYIECEEILDPRSIESKTQSYQGSLYGSASNAQMAAFFRHPNFSSDVKNLYFVGGSVHPGGGIPLALSSAKIVDSLIKSHS